MALSKQYRQLAEIELNQIFKPSTLSRLKKQTGTRKKEMLGSKNPTQAAVSTITLVQELSSIESPYKSSLEQVAIDVVYDLYPRLEELVKDGEVEIDAKLITLGGVGGDEEETSQDDDEKTSSEKAEDIEIAKRRIINSITQGGSVKGAFGLLYSDIKDNINAIDDSLMDKYKDLLNLTFGSYADDQVVSLFMTSIALAGPQYAKQAGAGSSEVDIVSGEEDVVYKIRAKGACFAILIHEILKGYYEYMSLKGFSPEKSREKNAAIVAAADKLEHEPRDLQTGPEIYQALNNLFVKSDYQDLRIRDLFFEKIYQLNDKPFVEFVENAINEELTTTQKSWVESTLRNLSMKVAGKDAGIDLGGNEEDEDEDALV